MTDPGHWFASMGPFTATATVVAQDGASEGVSWSSGNEAVFTVDSQGVVTPVASGAADLVATSDFDGSQATMSVRILIPNPTGGSVNVMPVSVTGVWITPGFEG